MSARIHFDPDNARGPRETPEMFGGAEDPARDDPRAMSVSALVSRVKRALTDSLPKRVSVVGEISNFKHHGSGHMYFSLKDAESQIAAVMFRSAAMKVKFAPHDGLEVVVSGRVDVYEPQGKLQFYVETMIPKGAGALELAFRQLVEKLRAEGLFDPERKKPIPRYPQTICVITSPSGAAIRDIRRTLARRWPAATVYLIPVSVQGDSAAGQIARAVRLTDANAERLGLDVLIVARGGGSLEDLWCFNEEPVARAIAACRVPVISGVGHETDTTITDMVADLRAPTPTGAAELATPDGQQLRRLVAQLVTRLNRRVAEQLATGQTALRLVRRSEFFRDPLHRVRTFAQRIDETASRLRAMLIQRQAGATATVGKLAEALRWQLGGLTKRKGDLLARCETRHAQANPIHRIRLARGDVRGLSRQLESLLAGLRAARLASVDRHEAMLEALSYRGTLRRGYTVTRNASGRIVRTTRDVAPGERIRTELTEGEIRSTADGQRARKRPHSTDDTQQATLF